MSKMKKAGEFPNLMSVMVSQQKKEDCDYHRSSKSNYSEESHSSGVGT